MIKSLRDRLFDFLKPSRSVPAPLNEASSLHEISVQYPNLHEFVERRYGVKVDAENQTRSLKEFVEQYGLPPAQIVFMEIQMDGRFQGVRELRAQDAETLMRTDPRVRVLDIREGWEIKIARLPGSQVLAPELLDEILSEWPKATPILVYCHFGVRSLDAATFLSDRGFTEVYTLKGGIDAWSVDIDPKIMRYQNAYC